MSTRDIIFILIGLFVALTTTWILLIRKFILFINNERVQNELYRLNAIKDYKNSSPELENQSSKGDELNAD